MEQDRENRTEDAPTDGAQEGSTKIKKGPLKKAWNYFQDFCSNTSLHGLHYIADEDRPLTEKLCWLLLFGASLGVCASFILQVKRRWDSAPVIVTFSQTSMPVWDIPFPAVTICPQSKIRGALFNFTELRSNEETAESKLTGDLSLVCNLIGEPFGNDTTDNGALETIAQAAPLFQHIIFRCIWKSNVANCSKLFRPLLTDEGLCFSFNILDEQDLLNNSTVKPRPLFEHKLDNNFTSHEVDGWALEGGYSKPKNQSTFPFRTSSSGSRAGLQLMIHSNTSEIDRFCSWPTEGFKMYLHNPADYPQMSSKFFRIPLDMDLVAAVKPLVMTTSEELINYPPNTRQCYFVKERHLRFFKVYTESNCEMECLTNVTEKLCRCVAYYMPRDNGSFPICGPNSTDCVSEAEDKLHELGEDACSCLPACTEIKYDVETSHARFDWKRIIELDNLTEGFTMGAINIYFEDNRVVTLYRSELYGLSTFLANIGGILGLFMGFSILSLVEIVYFLTLRLFCNWRRKRTNKKRGNSSDGKTYYF